MPGTPPLNDPIPPLASIRPNHPAALLLFALLVGAGISFSRAPFALGAAVLVFAAVALRAEGKRWRGELTLAAIAGIVFLAHAGFARFEPGATRDAALLALRLLALVYLTRWAARAFLPKAARWLLGLRFPTRPRALALAAESARFSAAILPLAMREAESQTVALRARGVRPGRGFTGRARFTAAWLLPFLGTMLRVGDSLSDALHARGYVPGARRAALVPARWTAGDGFAVLAGIAFLGVMLRGR